MSISTLRRWSFLFAWIVLGLCLPAPASACGAELVGHVLDAETRAPLAARVYVRDAQGSWRFVETAHPDGSALPYREQWVPMPDSVEQHTTISAHPFRISLEPGEYEVTVERGKEYFPLTRRIIVAEQTRHEEEFVLCRWVNMAERGWYSGETHVHRRHHELPNVQLAEDLNVAFPVTFWTVNAGEVPGLEPSPLRSQGPSPLGPRQDLGHAMQTIDDTHVYFPRNTEYEIFFLGDRRHTLGAVFFLNHRTVFGQGAPPIREIAEQAHREGALIDLDKHSWPWSMMLVPIARVNLYELANNSVWRTNFGFRQLTVPPAPYMNVELDNGGVDEWGWLQFGFENYYTLLNCGFRLAPTAGTASGVHPVPLGFSRVYVHLDGPFDGQAWIEGLRQGRSFVTTGPMLFAQFRGAHPGHIFAEPTVAPRTYPLQVTTLSEQPLSRIDVIVNGRQVMEWQPAADRNAQGAFTSDRTVEVPLDASSWIAVRCFQHGEDGRVRFAHTAPWHVEMGGLPVQPRREEVAYLLHRMDAEIDRNRGVLSQPALDEFIEARQIFQALMDRAR